jgi:hypothetical protein
MFRNIDSEAHMGTMEQYAMLDFSLGPATLITSER